MLLRYFTTLGGEALQHIIPLTRVYPLQTQRANKNKLLISNKATYNIEARIKQSPSTLPSIETVEDVWRSCTHLQQQKNHNYKNSYMETVSILFTKRFMIQTGGWRRRPVVHHNIHKKLPPDLPEAVEFSTRVHDTFLFRCNDMVSAKNWNNIRWSSVLRLLHRSKSSQWPWTVRCVYI
jgi:hypothetical protein